MRTELGRANPPRLRRRGPGHGALAADYAQIELRIAAHITRDALLIEAFEPTRTSTRHRRPPSSTSPERVTDEQRRLAKTTNFAVLYGISDFGLSQRVGISRSEAGPFISAYLDKYPGQAPTSTRR